jgi:multiple sugar transport system substrate-binding protein
MWKCREEGKCVENGNWSGRRRARRWFHFLISSFPLISFLAGCDRGIADPAGTVRLSVWSMWTGGEEENFKRVLARYHALHPNVILENLGAVRDDTKTVRAIVAGVPPDLFTLADSLYLGPLAANGAVYALDDWFRGAGLREKDFVEASLYQCRYRGRLFAMPYLIDAQALLWNKKAFRRAGLDPEKPPGTLEELERYAVALTKHDSAGNMTQLGLAPVNHKTFSAGDIYLFFKLFGGRLYDPAANRLTADDPANIAALKWYAGLVNSMGGGRQVNAFAAGFGQAQGGNNPFFMGKAAMMINGEWTPYWAHRYAPGLEYGVAPIPPPANKPERARTTWFGGNMFCIPKGSRHPKEAWELLVWMQSDEAQILFAEAMNNVPNRISALRSKELRQGAPYKPLFAKFLDLADSPNGGAFPAVPVANLYANEIVNALDLVLDGQKSPESALRDVRERVQKELSRY